MAEIIDTPSESKSEEGDFLDVNELSVETKEEPKAAQTEQVGEKYADKSKEQLATELESAQSMIGRQSKDVSQMRREIEDLKTASAYTQGQLAGTSGTDAKKESPDYFGNPEGAIKETVAKELQGTKKEIQEFRAEQAVRAIHSAHPDAAQIIESPGFRDYIAQSPSRTVSHKAAIDSMDVNLWNELIDAYKSTTQTEPDPQVEALKSQSSSESVANASMGATAGSSPMNVSGKKIRKADLQRLYIDDRDRYNALWPEIEKAWAEGRVV